MQPQGLDLIDIIHKGAIATYPLILLSIVSVAVVFERLWSLRNIGSATLRVTDSILEPIKKGQRDLAIAICKQNSQCPAGRIFLNILDREAAGLEVANNIATEAMFEETQKLKKHLCHRHHQVLRKHGDRRHRRFRRGRRRYIGGAGGYRAGSGNRHHRGYFLQLLSNADLHPQRLVSH